MQVIDKRGRRILSWQAWERPVATYQWKEGRSAMEIARAFFRQGEARLPEPLVALLQHEPSTRNFIADEVYPELRTPLPPRGARGPRNHDVWVRGHVADQGVCIGLEAKADEPFGDPLAVQMKNASKSGSNNSKVADRLAILGTMVFGPSFDLRAPRYSGIGYQLLAGLAGTAIQAALDGARAAVFVVYEFATAQTNPRKRAKNAEDLEAFVQLLPGGCAGPRQGAVVGPIPIGRTAYMSKTIDVFIGKITDPGRPTCEAT